MGVKLGGTYATGNTLPVTGWRDWRQRLDLSGMGGAYVDARFPIPTITPERFWRQAGYVNAAFPVPTGMSGQFVTGEMLSRPKWGLSGPVDDLAAWFERNQTMVLLAGAGLLLLSGAIGGKKRRR